MPANSSCLYFQGTLANTPPTLFGYGLRRTSGGTIGLGTKLNSPSGTSAYPVAGDTSVSVRGLLPALGGKRSYPTWYRNAAAFCTTATFNSSNALEVYWVTLGSDQGLTGLKPITSRSRQPSTCPISTR